jgi:hypothetical protein
LEVLFLGVVFLRTFFLVGIRKVYHYQILRTTRGFARWKPSEIPLSVYPNCCEGPLCSVELAAGQSRVFQRSSASND